MKEFKILQGKRNPIHAEIESYAVTCALSRESVIDAEELRKFAAELMTSIANACFHYGAMQIGHIKALLEHETGFLSADTIGTPEDVMVEGKDGDPTKRFSLLINSVVYGLASDAVRRATEESLNSVSFRFGLVREP